MYLLLIMAANLILTVSTLHIYCGANLYSPYHKLSGQNIPVVYCSFTTLS